MKQTSGCHKDVDQLDILATSSPTQASFGSSCWILVQQNVNTTDLFTNRDWNSYRQGFGDATGDFWIGNKQLHRMTQLLNSGLQFEIYYTVSQNNCTLFISSIT